MMLWQFSLHDFFLKLYVTPRVILCIEDLFLALLIDVCWGEYKIPDKNYNDNNITDRNVRYLFISCCMTINRVLG